MDTYICTCITICVLTICASMCREREREICVCACYSLSSTKRSITSFRRWPFCSTWRSFGKKAIGHAHQCEASIVFVRHGMSFSPTSFHQTLAGLETQHRICAKPGIPISSRTNTRSKIRNSSTSWVPDVKNQCCRFVAFKNAWFGYQS